jgi:hypothetical protein
MTDHKIVDIWRGLPKLPFGKPWPRRDRAVTMWPALKLLVTVSLIVTLGGCVSTRQGDYETPFAQGSQGVDPRAP